jgi:hypothetical protein
MNRIIPPIQPRDQSPAVANLQEAMVFIVEKRALNPAGLSLARWRQELSTEVTEQSFGAGTSRLLAGLRADLHLIGGDSIDEQTAEALNQQLADLGAFQENVQAAFIVDGKVISRSRAGVGKLRVQIVDKNVGDPVQLAETATKEDGTYRATFTISDLRHRGKDLPDLQTHAFADDKFLGASEVRYNASNHETLNVVLTEEASGALPSEHASLTGALSSNFQGNLRDLQETVTRQDITYLANKSGWDARAVAMAALADQFSQIQTDDATPASIPSAFYYASFRAGLPSNPDTFYQADVATIERVWTQAIKQGVIPADLQGQVAAALQVFQKLGGQKILTAPALVGVSSIKEMLTASGVSEPRQQQQFAQLYTTTRTEMPTFWKAVEEAFGQERTQRMKVNGKLCFLTINNAPLIQTLHSAAGANGVSDPLQLAQMGFHRAEKWNALLRAETPIPGEVPGSTPQVRRTNYADYLAAKVRLSYPTASVAELVKSGDLKVDIPDQVEKFLTEHDGKFVIGMQAVEQYIAQNKLQVDPKVVAQVERIHRVYQITPSDQAMVGLLKNGLDAAYHVIRFDKEAFVRTYANDLGGAQTAAYTYSRAQQVHNVVLNVALSYLTACRGVPIGTHSAAHILDSQPKGSQVAKTQPVGLQAPDPSGIVAYPTLEGLFGSIDFCACEHCRSILSPAAYLVDLLLFLDHPADGNENPQTVLLGRRPDIQYLPLTCENTNTALPYIDLVNETLEYFVANSTKPLSLTNYKGHDTGDTASEDLLASPQSFNDDVRDAAYTTLRGERFPVTLPFHEPLESLRRYFNKFDVPLPLAMELLRKSDDLERGGNLYGWRDILMEEIGLSRDEYEILTDSPSTVPLWKMYGFPSGTQNPEVIAGFGNTFGLSNAKQFTRRVGITYEDLVAILQTQFVNPNSDLIPKVERLGVSFATLMALKDGHTSDGTPFSDADLIALLPAGAGAPDPAEYAGDIAAWVKDNGNYARITGLIVLAVPLGTWSSKNYLLGDCVKPTKHEAGSSFYYVCTKAGTSAALEPNPWPTSPGNTGSDGTVVWMCRDGTTDCNFDDWAFRYADPSTVTQNIQVVEFVRLLRFIRLWKKLGWSIEQTDAAICSLLALPPPALPFADAIDPVAKLDSGFLTLLPRLGIVLRVMKSLNLTPKRDLLSLLACWTDIGSHGQTALYRQMFLNPALLAQDAVFADNGYGEFLQQVAVSYTHPQVTLEQPIVTAGGGNAQGRISYDNLGKRLVYIGILDAATRDVLKAVPGVSPAFQHAVNALYSAQRLVSHSEALRSAFGQTSEEYSLVVAALGFDGGFVEVPYKHSHNRLEQSILDVAPGIGYDEVNTRLTYRGLFSSDIRKALKSVVGLDTKFQNAVDALYAANEAALAPLTLANISAVFRRGWLARKLKVSVRELLLLTQLTSLDPFAALNLTSPAIFQIISLVQALKDRGLKSSVPLYLIWNQDLSGKSAPDPAQVTEFARTLRGDFSSIDDQFALAEDPGGSLERAQFALVYGQEAADAFFALLDDILVLDVTYTHPHSTLEPAISAVDANLNYDDFRHRLSHKGLMVDPVLALLKTKAGVIGEIQAEKQFQAAVQTLSDKGLDVKGSFFTRYPELEQIYKALVLNSETFEADYTNLTPTLEPAVTGADQRISYDNANHHLLYSGILTSANRDKLKAVPGVTEAFQAAVDTLFARSEDAKAEGLATLRPELARRRKRQQTLQRLSAAASIELSSTQALLDPPTPPYPLDSVGQSGQSALYDFLSLATSGLAADSGIWSGQIETPEAGYYNFIIETDAGASVTLSLDGADRPLIANGNIWRNSQALELKAGTLYEIELKAEQLTEALSLKWETPKRSREVIPSRYLYSPVSLELCSDAYIRFLKVCSLAAGLHLTANELAYFATHSDYKINLNGNIDSQNGRGWLNVLPKAGNLNLQNPADAAIAGALNASLLIPLRALLNYARIKAKVSPADESLLTALEDPATATRKPDALLFTLTGWNQISLHDLLTHFGITFTDLGRFDQFRRVYDGLEIAGQMGISSSALVQAVTNEPDGAMARDLQAALRARYGDADWRDVVTPINDELRSLKRDALVAYILHQMRISTDTDKQNINTVDKLFEYFLMDVQMEPSIQTSRIRHALSSVQLFIERCLMNLEAGVLSGSLDAKQWAWRKRYRVWEANRKVFLWPENWAEPELRDDQSLHFKETMSELLQSDITEDSAATALLNYLSKLEEVAKLEPCGIHFVEGEVGTSDDIAHVVARTAGGHRKYYYRRFEDETWTPWEQIKLDIEDNPVIPVVWNDRLLLFWLRILKQGLDDPAAQMSSGGPPSSDGVTEKSITNLTLTDIKTNAKNDAATNTQVTVNAVLCWSEYYNGKWQSAKTSEVSRPVSLGTFPSTGTYSFDRSKLRLGTTIRSSGELVIYISPYWVNISNLRASSDIPDSTHAYPAFRLFNTHSLPMQDWVSLWEGTSFDIATIDTSLDANTSDGILAISYGKADSPSVQHQLLRNPIDHQAIVPRHHLAKALDAPFFYWDGRHAFYVTTKAPPMWIPDYVDFGLIGIPGANQIPSMVLQLDPRQTGPKFVGDGSSPGTDLSDIETALMERFVTEDAYIHKGIGKTGSVNYGGKRIGMSGAISSIQTEKI